MFEEEAKEYRGGIRMTKEELEKENAELKKDRDYFSGALDKQVEATLELQKKYQELEAQIEKMKADVKQGQSYWNSGEMQYDLYQRLLDKWEIKEK